MRPALTHLIQGLLLATITALPAAAQICGPSGCPPSVGGIQPTRPLVPVAPPGEIPEPVTNCYHSLVQVRCGQWGGSGTYLGDRLVITCEHVLRDGSGSAQVTFPGGSAVSTRALAVDAASDLALLELLGPAPAEAVGVALADGRPSLGEVVYSAGYGRSRNLMVSAGRISNLSQFTIAIDPTNGSRRPRNTTEATGLTESGDSGGAWLTPEGKLRGVVWGGRQQDGTVSATTELGGFLRDACDRWRRPFPQPSTPPRLPEPPPLLPPVVRPEAPAVDLGPIVKRLDDIDARLDDLQPKDRTSPLTWLAMLAAGAGAVFMFYSGNGGGD